MGDNCEIQLPQVDALGLDIVRENLRVIAGIKQDALATILDERGKSPIFLHRRGLAESSYAPSNKFKASVLVANCQKVPSEIPALVRQSTVAQGSKAPEGTCESSSSRDSHSCFKPEPIAGATAAIPDSSCSGSRSRRRSYRRAPGW